MVFLGKVHRGEVAVAPNSYTSQFSPYIKRLPAYLLSDMIYDAPVAELQPYFCFYSFRFASIADLTCRYFVSIVFYY